MALLRRLGVYGKNNPTKKNKAVQASDFLIGGMVGQFERCFDRTFVVRSTPEVQDIFGVQVLASQYGWDEVNGFFANISGVSARLYIKSHVDYSGSAIDAVTALQTLANLDANPVLTFKDGYKGDLGYGVSGNRTGITITNGDRFSTTAAGTCAAAGTSVVCSSGSGIRIGDIVKIVATAGGGATVYKKITGIDESTKTISWVGAFHASATVALTDAITVRGVRIRVWRKSLSGFVAEVDTDAGTVYGTTEPEVADFYIPNLFAQSKWLVIAKVATTPSSPEKNLPADIVAPQYPTVGAAGTSPTTAAHYDRDLHAFDANPVRFLCNGETTTAAIQQAGETYCKGRWDCPKWIANLPEAQTKAQLIAEGQAFQRSDDVLMCAWDKWLKVTDPFNKTSNAPFRSVPNVAFMLGLWIRIIGLLGVHYSPGIKDQAIFGAVDISNPSGGDPTLSDSDRTDIANAGVNVIQNLPGLGILPRNAFTPSTTQEFQFSNGIELRDYIKVSAVDSLQSSENTPNSLNRIREDKMAILGFLYRLWQVGSTGSVPLGETFGQAQNADGTETKPEEHFDVRADLVNNPQDRIDLGERNLDVYFTFPAPAGSIQIGVGILLRS